MYTSGSAFCIVCLRAIIIKHDNYFHRHNQIYIPFPNTLECFRAQTIKRKWKPSVTLSCHVYYYMSPIVFLMPEIDPGSKRCYWTVLLVVGGGGGGLTTWGEWSCGVMAAILSTLLPRTNINCRRQAETSAGREKEIWDNGNSRSNSAEFRPI